MTNNVLQVEYRVYYCQVNHYMIQSQVIPIALADKKSYHQYGTACINVVDQKSTTDRILPAVNIYVSVLYFRQANSCFKLSGDSKVSSSSIASKA